MTFIHIKAIIIEVVTGRWGHGVMECIAHDTQLVIRVLLADIGFQCCKVNCQWLIVVCSHNNFVILKYIPRSNCFCCWTELRDMLTTKSENTALVINIWTSSKQDLSWRNTIASYLSSPCNWVKQSMTHYQTLQCTNGNIVWHKIWFYKLPKNVLLGN